MIIRKGDNLFYKTYATFPCEVIRILERKNEKVIVIEYLDRNNFKHIQELELAVAKLMLFSDKDAITAANGKEIDEVEL